MKKVFALFISIIFIAAMTGCQLTAAPSGTPVTVNSSDAAEPVVEQPKETVQAAVSGGSYQLTIDVNPSIELTVKDGLVTGAAAYNDDGQAILLSASVTGLSANGAIDAIITEIAGAGYLNAADKEPYVLVTVAGGEDKPELREELEEYTEKALEDAGVDSEVKTAAVSDDIVNGAAAKGMSAGRYMIFQYIAKEKGITFEEAVALYGAMNIGQLMEQFEDLDEAFDEDGIEDIEDIEDEDADDQGEDIEDKNDDDQDKEDIEDENDDDQDEEDIEDENDDEDDDQDNDQNDDRDDDRSDDEQHEDGGGDDEGEDD